MKTSSSYNDHSSASPSLRSPSTASHPPRSPWHSPVPYLLGGLAAMIGLIAFALLVLVCSYWKLSGHLEGGEDHQGESGVETVKVEVDTRVFEDDFLVIMAGEIKPTHLATPSTSKTSSFLVNSERRRAVDDHGGTSSTDPDH
uniref:Uncharacterized protein n=1 Tax=Kalanchoe fedtschenkoi TaxID=63787 RepID=A0A7N0VI72_KALFE